jgi:hypothetical protein
MRGGGAYTCSTTTPRLLCRLWPIPIPSLVDPIYLLRLKGRVAYVLQ